MTQYVLSGVVGPDDSFVPSQTANEKLVSIDLLSSDHKTLRFGIDDVLQQMKQMNLAATSVGVDLMVLAVMAFIADTRVSRAQAAQDRWTRQLKLVVPVRAQGIWDDVAPLLNRTLGFLTGDKWKLEFRQVPFEAYATPAADLFVGHTDVDTVCLFSGGLDSLIGAIDLLENEQRKPLFVSHGGASAVSKPQAELFDSLMARYPGQKTTAKRFRHGIRVDAKLFEHMDTETTTRGRSFLFFALAALVGSALGRQFELVVPENGLISVNVPLDPTRLGSNSTRTTHPFYIHRWNDLLGAIGIRGWIKNPYWNKTKGEMVKLCSNLGVLESLHADSISCAHPDVARWEQDGIAHCGSCLPCIIRRASLRDAPWEGGDATQYRIPDLGSESRNAGKADGEQVRAFQVAIHRLKVHPGIAESLIYKPGPLAEDAEIVRDLVGVYCRGMEEVRHIVQGVTTVSSDRSAAAKDG